jgi:spore maturation protein CgeB
MRLFEATGAGALLVTDWKENLEELFDIGREVVAFRSTNECTDLIEYYMTHEDERARIATAGQARCLRDHTYERRAVALAAILQNLLR